MTNEKPSLRFDHREIAVIFSLFVFVSLLMFTVGILVGKGLAQAKYDGAGMLERKLSNFATIDKQSDSLASPLATGSSLMTSEPAPVTRAEIEKKVDEQTTGSAPLVLVPQKERTSINREGLAEPKESVAADALLKNPRIQSLVEEDPKEVRRKLAMTNGGTPMSFASGKYTVQVGSYPTEKDAGDRVEALKRLGFPNAHFSAKELGDNKATWFRVWLGFFPDYDSADDSGKFLKERGEVRQYLVRKADTSG